MTEDQEDIQRLIKMYKGDEDYHDFETGDDYIEYKERKAKEYRNAASEKNKAPIYELIAQNRVNANKWINAFHDYAYWLDSDSKNAYRLYVELFSDNKIPVEAQFPLFMHVYVHYPVEKRFEKYLMEAFDNYPEKKKEKLRKDVYNKLCNCREDDGFLKVYRGEYIEAEFGSSIEINQAISFTMDYEQACFFACRWSPKEAYVYTAKVAFEDIIYFTGDRNESEVIILPESKGRKFMDLKCEAVNPKEYYKGNTAVANEARLRMAIENGISVEEYKKMHPEYFKK